jgi:hypothetical protein
LVLQLFTKHVPNSRPPTISLVVARQVPGGTPELFSAVEIRADLVAGISDMQPLQLLRLVSDRFGLEIPIGNERKKLYFCEAVEPVDGEPMMRGQPPIRPRSSDDDLAAEIIARLGRSPAMWRCGLCFALDVRAYRNHLAVRK